MLRPRLSRPSFGRFTIGRVMIGVAALAPILALGRSSQFLAAGAAILLYIPWLWAFSVLYRRTRRPIKPTLEDWIGTYLMAFMQVPLLCVGTLIAYFCGSTAIYLIEGLVCSILGFKDSFPNVFAQSSGILVAAVFFLLMVRTFDGMMRLQVNVLKASRSLIDPNAPPDPQGIRFLDEPSEHTSTSV